MNGRVTALTGREIVTASPGSPRLPDPPGREPHSGFPPVVSRTPDDADDVVKEGSRGQYNGTCRARCEAGPHPLPVHRRDRRRDPRHRRGPDRPRLRGRAQAARYGLREPDQDDDLADHLLHDRAGHRLGTEGHQGRCSRRSGARLLPGDVPGRAHHRSGGRQHPAPGRGPRADGRDQADGPRPGVARGAAAGRLRALDHPHHLRLRLHPGPGPADPPRRPPRRIRPSGDGLGQASRSCAVSSTSSGSSSASSAW